MGNNMISSAIWCKCMSIQDKKIARTLKNIAESQGRRNLSVICNLHSCYNCSLALHENTLVFSRSEERNFFIYITVEKNSYYLF